MAPLLRFRKVHLLEGPGQDERLADVLVDGRRLVGIDPLDGDRRDGETALTPDPQTEVVEVDAGRCWLAPALVDPHSLLEDPTLGRAETLTSLRSAAAAGGYGTVALLPQASSWRDRPERLDICWSEPMRLPLWGSWSLEGRDQVLALHAEQLMAGAIGLAAGSVTPPLALLERGLQLAEMGGRPVLIAPRDFSLSRDGVVRERVEALRAGWPPDPPLSESLPLQTLLTLMEARSGVLLRLMNLSTTEAVTLLRQCPQPPMASVSWWHLITDSGNLDPASEGWRVEPPLGGPLDREALISALAEGLISAVAVHHHPHDAEELLLPTDQRRPGLAGHGVALTLLWWELVERRGWTPSQLWQVLCWGPSRFLGLEPETLVAGGERWLLFDPGSEWRWEKASCPSLAANQPFWGQTMQGRVVASGLSEPDRWPLQVHPWR